MILCTDSDNGVSRVYVTEKRGEAEQRTLRVSSQASSLTGF